MDRRQFLISTSLAVTSTMLPMQRLFAYRMGEFVSLRRNVGYFTEQGGTIGWLASDDALVVIDSQYPEPAQNCLNGLQQRTSHNLDMLINTHHHGDHTGGNGVFQPAADRMVAHENVPRLMRQASEDDENLAVPTTTYSEEWSMDVGSETVHLRYLGPAHTSGDSVVYFEKANVVHMGDLIFNRMNPYTDRPSGASVYNWIELLGQVKNEYPADAIYIFGHSRPDAGVSGKAEDLDVMRNYLSAMVEHVEQGIEEGQSKEEITDLEELEGFEDFLYADFWSLSQNLGVVYEEAMER